MAVTFLLVLFIAQLSYSIKEDVFRCSHDVDRNKTIPIGFKNDGVCDCCDGIDEVVDVDDEEAQIGSWPRHPEWVQPQIPCPNKCDLIAEINEEDNRRKAKGIMLKQRALKEDDNTLALLLLRRKDRHRRFLECQMELPELVKKETFEANQNQARKWKEFEAHFTPWSKFSLYDLLHLFSEAIMMQGEHSCEAYINLVKQTMQHTPKAESLHMIDEVDYFIVCLKKDQDAFIQIAGFTKITERNLLHTVADAMLRHPLLGSNMFAVLKKTPNPSFDHPNALPKHVFPETEKKRKQCAALKVEYESFNTLLPPFPAIAVKFDGNYTQYFRSYFRLWQFCVESTAFRICFFQNVTQLGSQRNSGIFSGWLSNSNSNKDVMLFSHGDSRGCRGTRETSVQFHCSDDDSFLAQLMDTGVQEPSQCVYALQVKTFLAC
eukprot:PhF_6_TR11025/c0_g1_i1/m.17861